MLKLKRYWKVFKYIYNRGAEGLDDTLRMYERAEKDRYQLYGNNTVHNSKIGRHSYVAQNSLIYNTDIGNYCSIGPNVVIGFGEHPIGKFSTSPHIYYNEALYGKDIVEENQLQFNKRVTIQNDVWIGGNVLIRNGVTIGNGAIIGANSLVMHDVPEYAVVVGSPGMIKKYRFDEKTIEKIKASKWWELELEELIAAKDKAEIVGLLKLGSRPKA